MSSGAVLIVEDDFDVRDSLADVLRDAGYEIDTACNGRDALAKIRKGPLPAVIILDLMMPVMDGFQFRSEQRADPSLACIPLIVLTADRRVDHSALAADGYVTKPTRIAVLLELLGRLMDGPTLS